MVFDRDLKSRFSENGIFQKVPFEPEALENLSLKLKQSLPRSAQLYNISLLYAQGRLPHDVMQCSFYEYVTPDVGNGVAVEDTFIVCIQKPTIVAKNVGVLIFPPVSPTKESLAALQFLFNWEESISFHSIPEPFWSTHLKPIVAKFEGGTCVGRDVPVKQFYLTNDEATRIKLPLSDSYTIRPLTVQDVPTIMANWTYGHDRSETLILKLIHTTPSCGLYVQKFGGENGGEELASSFLVSTLGLCNILFTEEHHRGKGYGKIVIEHLVKDAAEILGYEPMIETVEDNVACRKCIQKCGFNDLHNANWYWYK